jgi:ribonuclease R
VPVRLIRGERFDLNETETALVGGRSGRAIRLGDPLSVRVDRVEAPRGRVDLVPAGEIGAGRAAVAGSRRERR